MKIFVVPYWTTMFVRVLILPLNHVGSLPTCREAKPIFGPFQGPKTSLTSNLGFRFALALIRAYIRPDGNPEHSRLRRQAIAGAERRVAGRLGRLRRSVWHAEESRDPRESTAYRHPREARRLLSRARCVAAATAASFSEIRSYVGCWKLSRKSLIFQARGVARTCDITSTIDPARPKFGRQATGPPPRFSFGRGASTPPLST